MYEVRKGVLFVENQSVEAMTSPNRGGKFPAPPAIVVMHFTAGGSGRSSANWFRHPDNSSSSAHIVIERDGSIIQCVNFNDVAWHAGKSTWKGLTGLNRYSIGIELANWGMLRGSGSEWVNGAGQKVTDPYIGVHRNGNPDGSHRPVGWEAFPKAQFDSARAVVTALSSAYPIKEIVGHDDIAPTRKSDPGPAFDMNRFRSLVYGDRKDKGGNVKQVGSTSGLNLRSGPGLNFSVLRLLDDKTKVEPISIDGNWVEISVLDKNGNAVATGWVHGHYLRDT